MPSDTAAPVVSKKPSWLKVKVPAGENYLWLLEQRKSLKLATVCEEARCPNIGECWESGTATFMLMGDTCTRGCKFCNIKTSHKPPSLDPDEGTKLAETLMHMGLSYVVLTTVDRDDLIDQGSLHIKDCIQQVQTSNPDLLIEILMPDFQGKAELIQNVVDANPAVIAHNIETVARLQKKVRDRRAGYEQSLSVLRYTKQQNPAIYTKSSIMLGLGEVEAEVEICMQDLRAAKVDFLTLGQYLKPRTGLLDVIEYVPPEQFDYYKAMADSYGFLFTASGPLVRSSYKASEVFIQGILHSRPKQRS